MTAATRVRRGCALLWVIVGIIEISLLARILAILVWGINGDHSGTSDATTTLYGLTGTIVDRLDTSANFIIPYQGLHHAFDIAALLAMVAIFFSTLALTKIVLWYVNVRAAGQKPIRSACHSVWRMVRGFAPV